MGVLCVGRDEGGDAGAEGLELSLGLGLEQRQLGDIDGLGRVVGIDNNGSRTRLGTAGADSNISEHIGSMSKIGLLLSTSKSLTLFGLGLLVFLVVLGFSLLLSTLSLTLSDSLTLGLLGSSGGLGGLLLSLGGLALLLTFGIGVVGIPRV